MTDNELADKVYKEVYPAILHEYGLDKMTQQELDMFFAEAPEIKQEVDREVAKLQCSILNSSYSNR